MESLEKPALLFYLSTSKIFSILVVAPISTVDMRIAGGADIPIEQRAAEELLTFGGQPVAAAGAEAWNPSFDVTPAALVDALVTERGVALTPDAEKMARLMAA